MHVIDENGKQGIVVEGLIATGDNDEFSRLLEGARDKSSSLVGGHAYAIEETISRFGE